MNKRIKNKWIKALRSGKYKQATGALKKVDEKGKETYCCLGVLCDVIDSKGWTKTMGDRQGFLRRDNTGLLPKKVLRLIKLKTDSVDEGNMRVNYKKQSCTLTSLNDIKHLSFKKIASIIEEQL